LDEGKTIGAVARELDLTASSVANWVKQVRADRTQGKTGLTTTGREHSRFVHRDAFSRAWATM
jgi:transposase-like protein